MAYDGSSFYGDLICDEYDEDNNFMNPESPTGYYIYYILGYGFDMMSDMCSQFMIDFSILTADTKGLDKFWGISYNLPRPKIVHKYSTMFEDKGVLSDYNSDYYIKYEIDLERMENETLIFGDEDGILKMVETVNGDFKLDFDFMLDIVSNYITNTSDIVFKITDDLGFCFGDLGIDSDCHITIKRENNNVILYVNDKSMGFLDVIDDELSPYFSFNYGGGNPYGVTGGSFKFKNLTLEYDGNKLTELTDDEYKIYLYLRNCRLITKEDLEICFNNCFKIDDNEVYFSVETNYLDFVDHINYKSLDDITSNIKKNVNDLSDEYITDFENNDDVERLEGLLSVVEEEELIINIPYNEYDENFLKFLEPYISIKGNIKIKEYLI